MAQSGLQFAVSVMVVNDLDYPDGGDPRFVDPAPLALGDRIVVGFEDEARRSTKVERILAGTVACKPMKAAGCTAHVGQGRSGVQHAQATPDGCPLLCTEALNAGPVGLACLRELAISPRNVNLSDPLT